MIETQVRRDSIDARFAQNRTTWGRKALGALIADIVFWRTQALPISSSFNTTAIDGDQFLADASGTAFDKQFLNEPFRLLVVALAEVVMAQSPLGVDKIESWPILVLECAPYREIIVDRDRIRQSHVLHGTANVIDIPLEWELGGVHPNHDQSEILVLLRPSANVWSCAQPVDAGIGPDIDEDDFSTQA